jgi:hypothetical protein
MLIGIPRFLFAALRLVSLPPPLVKLKIVVGVGVPDPRPAFNMVAAGSAPGSRLVHKVTGLADPRERSRNT